MADIPSLIANRVNNPGLRERQFEFTQERAQQTDLLKAQQEARAQALAERDLALKATTLQHETQQAYDTADFLKHFQGVQHNDPKYEDKIAQLAATYPLAGGDKSVQEIVGIRNTARQNYLEATKSGGAYELPEGPARDTYHKVFGDTADVNAARAAGKSVEAGEKAVRDAVSQGFLTADDFAHTEGAPLPPVYNKDGSINYQQAQLLAAQRSGKTVGKVAVGEDKDLALAQAYVTSYLKKPESYDEDPNGKELFNIYSKKLLDHERGKTNSAAGPAATSPEAPGAPATPAQPAGTPAPTLAATPKNVVSAEDYAALAPGETFISNGKLGRKPLPKK